MRLLLLLLILAQSTQALELPTTKPTTGLIHRWISLPATLAPWQQATLHAKVTGYIATLTVDKGDTVTAGQILVTLEVPELLADIAKSKAEVTVAQIEVKRLHEARAKSPDIVLPQAVDDAEAKLAIAKAGLERSETQIQFASLRAPFDGIVTARHADPGSLVAANTTKLLEITDLSTLRLQIPVTELETGLVTVGKPVKAQIDALGATAPSVEASISRIAYALDPATRTMLAEADIKNPDLKLRSGMYVMTKIATEKHEDTTLIPVGALVLEKANAFVFKRADGKAMKTAVKIGFNDGVNVEVTGLKLDDELFVPGTVTLADKQAVGVKP
ncbi:efflux RND transporter periplasmic adaptor subunit [Prosthecobacter dejongeii]|uniref:Membrane fusion protein (Multidrug efflux system) n=1 Tax=Prosthecobacter dejongeii TaxID=48465 RepID=A0A7W8DPU9_9BACT|nr:efflux RND transporter periplasmic adaptor subunit [Prosthecobacter dejongeii]MBB5037550.1 membrane fusion protein (multidrug efflux system) [Prosthecobacter dejongeii]